jgi:hypothetical protein
MQQIFQKIVVVAPGQGQRIAQIAAQVGKWHL